MKNYLLYQYILPICQKQKKEDWGVTIFDLLFEIVLLGIVVITIPSIFKSSVTCNSVGCNSKAALVLRMR